MTTEQTAEFVRVVDEMRRLQQVTKRPPDAQAARMLRLSEGTVDLLLMKYREPDPEPSMIAPVAPAAPTITTSETI